MTEPATQPEPQLPWCCTGRGYVSECPLCPEYGTSLLEPCPGHEASEANQTRVAEARLHAERRHPGYEYATTTGPRKQWDDPDRPPSDDRGDPDPSWQPNLDAGYPGAGWERFDYHEEAYWRRPKTPPQPADAPRSAVQAADGPAEPGGAHDGAQAAQGATVDPAVCPRCKGDNREAFALCPSCAEADGRLLCPYCREDITDYAEDDHVWRTGDDRPYCSGECVIAAHRAARSDVGTEFVQQIDHPDEAGLTAVEPHIPDGDIQQLAVAILRVQRLIDAHPVSVPTNLLEEALDQPQEQP